MLSNLFLIASIHPFYGLFSQLFVNIFRSHLICSEFASGHNICWRLANSLHRKMDIKVTNYNNVTLIHRKCWTCRRLTKQLKSFIPSDKIILYHKSLDYGESIAIPLTYVLNKEDVLVSKQQIGLVLKYFVLKLKS